MSTKIRVSFRSGGQAEVINASREKISVKGPGWEDFVEVRSNQRFSGNFQSRAIETLKPVVPEAAEPPQYPSVVRRATEDDIDALYLVVPRFLEETNLLPVSTAKIQRLIERCAMREGGAIAGIIDGPDGIDGSIGLDVAESDVSDRRYVRGIWLGLHPDLRANPPRQGGPRANLGRRLFEFARWYHGQLEQQAGYPILMQFDVTTRVALGPKLGFFERNAMPVGAIFAYLSNGSFLAQNAEAA